MPENLVSSPVFPVAVALKNSAVSRHVAIIVAQQPTEALSSLHLAAVAPQVWHGGEELVTEPLVIALRINWLRVLLIGITS
jgi:hypothetical protein